MIERRWNADLIAKVLGGIFIVIGLLGFAPNPLVSETGFFQVNDAHNFVHILTGVALGAGAFLGAPARTIRVIAVLYAIIAIVGFVTEGDMLFGAIQMNAADRWLHVGLAVILLAIGFLTPIEERVGHVGA
jgi:hypothetical protein